MFAVLVESGDVLELAFVLLFLQCGNHNSSGCKKKKRLTSKQIIGFGLFLLLFSLLSQ